MAVQDDLRRLSQLDSIYVGVSSFSSAVTLTGWYKGRLMQSNDGKWIFRSINSDGTLIGFQLGYPDPSWQSSEGPALGIAINVGNALFLQQQLPQEMTN